MIFADESKDIKIIAREISCVTNCNLLLRFVFMKVTKVVCRIISKTVNHLFITVFQNGIYVALYSQSSFV